MVTKKLMWVCGKGLSLELAGCFVDEGKVIAFTTMEDDGDLSVMDDNELYTPTKYDHFFDSRDEAVAFNEQLEKTYRSKIKEVAPIINMFKFRDSKIKVGDYIEGYNKEEPSWMERDYQHYRDICALLSNAIATGFLNINGENVRISEVVRVEWHRPEGKQKYAIVVMRNDDKVKTHDNDEFDAVGMIFGPNESGVTYKS